MIDQPKLPFKFSIHECNTYKDTTKAISDMIVRGAPAIGATAGYATAQAALEFKGTDYTKFLEHMKKAARLIKKARPTAVDLEHAVDRVMKNMKGWDSVGKCGITWEISLRFFCEKTR